MAAEATLRRVSRAILGWMLRPPMPIPEGGRRSHPFACRARCRHRCLPICLGLPAAGCPATVSSHYGRVALDPSPVERIDGRAPRAPSALLLDRDDRLRTEALAQAFDRSLVDASEGGDRRNAQPADEHAGVLVWIRSTMRRASRRSRSVRSAVVRSASRSLSTTRKNASPLMPRTDLRCRHLRDARAERTHAADPAGPHHLRHRGESHSPRCPRLTLPNVGALAEPGQQDRAFRQGRRHATGGQDVVNPCGCSSARAGGCSTGIHSSMAFRIRR